MSIHQKLDKGLIYCYHNCGGPENKQLESHTKNTMKHHRMFKWNIPTLNIEQIHDILKYIKKNKSSSLFVKSLPRKLLSGPGLRMSPSLMFFIFISYWLQWHPCELIRITLYRGLQMVSNGIAGITIFNCIFMLTHSVSVFFLWIQSKSGHSCNQGGLRICKMFRIFISTNRWR